MCSRGCPFPRAGLGAERCSPQQENHGCIPQQSQAALPTRSEFGGLGFAPVACRHPTKLVLTGFMKRSERTERGKDKKKKPEFLQGSSGRTGIDAALMRQPHKQGSSGKGCSISGRDFPVGKARSAERNTCSRGSRRSAALLWLRSESDT